jgi:hypothetical protein
MLNLFIFARTYYYYNNTTWFPKMSHNYLLFLLALLKDQINSAKSRAYKDFEAEIEEIAVFSNRFHKFSFAKIN